MDTVYPSEVEVESPEGKGPEMVAVLPLTTTLPALTVTLPGVLLKVTVMVALGWMVLPLGGTAETKLTGGDSSLPQPTIKKQVRITKKQLKLLNMIKISLCEKLI